MAQSDLIVTAYRQVEGGLAFGFPAHRQVEGLNDPRNPFSWARLCPEEYLQVLREKDGGPEDPPFHSARAAEGREARRAFRLARPVAGPKGPCVSTARRRADGGGSSVPPPVAVYVILMRLRPSLCWRFELW